MTQFIHYGETPTPAANEIGSYPTVVRLTPFMYIGNTEGFSAESYDPFDEYTLKEFKLSVASLAKEPMLRLDTIDLYNNFCHTGENAISEISATTLEEISKSCPVRFQRIHFYATREDGSGGEYSAIFLIGQPVSIGEDEEDYSDGDAEIWSPGYANQDGEFEDRLVLGGHPAGAGFKITAKKKEDGTYDVNIRGGTAQAFGQVPVDIPKNSFEGISAPQYFYITYDNTTFEWDLEIKIASEIPSVENPYPIVIGALDDDGIRQDRLGTVEVVVTRNSVDYRG